MFFVFFNDTATTEIYTLSLHDALPISTASRPTGPRREYGTSSCERASTEIVSSCTPPRRRSRDRKSTRLNSSHANISYAVFCLKKKPRYAKHQDCTHLWLSETALSQLM